MSGNSGKPLLFDYWRMRHRTATVHTTLVWQADNVLIEARSLIEAGVGGSNSNVLIEAGDFY